MTIIQPNKNKRYFTPPFIFLAVILILTAISGIYLYNQNVNLKHFLTNNLDKLQDLQETNADYKNKLYQVLDPQNIPSIAQELNLVQEKYPKYFENKEILASQNDL